MKNGKEMILLVESDTEEIEAEKNFLSGKQHEIIVEEDGKKALDYLSKHPNDIDLVVTSLDISVINGIELLKLLKLSQRMQEVPVVLILPADRQDEIAEAMDNGAEDIILKPYDGREAANRIRNILMSKDHAQYVNVMEEILEKELDQCIDSLGMCKCRQCRKDVITMSLNRLRPRYVSTEKGRLLSVIDQMSYDYVPEMLRAITESSEIVKKNPRHGKL